MILGVDLGQKNTGIAISEGVIASPLVSIRHKSIKEALDKISKICEEEGIDTVVVGFVEGKTKKYFEKFAEELRVRLPFTKIVLWDETLSTLQARQTMIKLHIPKTKRSQKEHEVAASLILQSFLDSL